LKTSSGFANGPTFAVTRREAGQVELFFAETPNGLGAEGNCLKLNAKVKSQFCDGKATRSYQQCQSGSDHHPDNAACSAAKYQIQPPNLNRERQDLHCISLRAL
jgi:hypothetical protein